MDVYVEMGLDHAMASMLHGIFDETASNASTLGALDAAWLRFEIVVASDDAICGRSRAQSPGGSSIA